MNEITGINHYGLRVKELDIARAFYAKLGFEFIAGPIGPEPVAIMKHPAGVTINFILNASKDAPVNNVLMDHASKPTGYTHVALEVVSTDRIKRRLEELNIRITEAAEFDGGRSVFIRDPDDNVLEFHQPLTGG